MLEERIRADLLVARKSKNELKTSILRVLVGDIDMYKHAPPGCHKVLNGILPDEFIHPIIRKLIASNNECLAQTDMVITEESRESFKKLVDYIKSDGKTGGVTDLVWGPAPNPTRDGRLLEENEILSQYLPKILSAPEIMSLLTPSLEKEIIAATPNDVGKLIGKILSWLKSLDYNSNGNEVKKLIEYIKKDAQPIEWFPSLVLGEKMGIILVLLAFSLLIFVLLTSYLIVKELIEKL